MSDFHDVGDPVPPTAVLTAEQKRVFAAELAALVAASDAANPCN